MTSNIDLKYGLLQLEKLKSVEEIRLKLDMNFLNILNSDQQADLECEVTKDEIKRAVWDCGTDKSPGMFNGISLDASLHLSHMFYADDAIFVGQWNESNINTIVHVLDCFHRASGIRINMSKSKLLGISVDADKVDQEARKIGKDKKDKKKQKQSKTDKE
ncbi:hypothetical protein Tco_1047177, partial [Tanacetum coccineum]